MSNPATEVATAAEALHAKLKLDADSTNYYQQHAFNDADRDLMARINAQNDEKDREEAERAAATKCPERSCALLDRPAIVVRSTNGAGFNDRPSSAVANGEERRRLDPNHVPSFW
ncbi:hypothetical protein AB1Y20_019302 [Prymnesium parvum]|uniref:Uncharacterized protein n=1 Tax=Prymnesium parvum TaxID=97485 RepID=A0AB34JTQ9_PRYPA|eukprot:CAMPEP_0205866448 /NCGR_PEP_ID=MMETSP1083-20121108/8422_1 /ASSEMBLY_ACC=CAM_ASM_000430 /TAXON_ID=97485 /ORGANISM="Prymnesium parvum, Strain Texoma1" /LENGTH=114 /DNA_ID=CAMNT_0053228447 /DNA_START=146 /DNA_END=490 /DNA_ORIENTATION=-